LTRVAQATVVPKLRITIERAAEEDNEAMARALEELEDDERRDKRQR
jgi:hypothetical protein